MQIIWKGQSCFQIAASSGKNHHINIVIDPFSEELGLRLPKLTADIVLVTHRQPDHNNAKAVLGTEQTKEPFLIEGPGEYEIKGVFIQGISAFHDAVSGKENGQNTIYTIEIEDIKICHLGDLGQKELTPEQLDEIGEIDVLMIPVGGGKTIGDKEAVKIMSQIEPSITIPMHYAIPKLKMKLDSVDKFLKVMGIKSLSPENKLTIKKRDISSEEAKIIVLSP